MGVVRSQEGSQVQARRGLIVGAAGAVVLGAAVLWPALAGSDSSPDERAQGFDADVAWAHAMGLHDESVEGPFLPKEAATREQIAVMLYRLAGSPDYPIPETSPYRDVTLESANVGEILWCRGRGIAFGAFDATFRPTEKVSRAEALAYLYRMLRVALKIHTQEASLAPAAVEGLSDVPAQHRYAREIEWARSVGLVSPEFVAAPPAQTVRSAALRPDDHVTREELVHVLRQAERLFDS